MMDFLDVAPQLLCFFALGSLVTYAVFVWLVLKGRAENVE